MSNSLISIIMPAFNAERTIASSINSVIRQTYKNWELIIINDGSSDNTKSIVEKIVASENRIILISTKNNGMSKARNLGINNSKGKYIAFLDSDDLWLEMNLEEHIKFHAKNPEVAISYSKYGLFNENKVFSISHLIQNKISLISHPKNFNINLLKKNTIGILTVLLDKNIIQEKIFFDEGLWGVEDYDLWIRLSLLNYKFGFINKELALYRLSSTSVMSKLERYEMNYNKLLSKYNEEINKFKIRKSVLTYYYHYFGKRYQYIDYAKFKLYLTKLLKVNPFSFYSIHLLLIFIANFIQKR